MLSDDIRHELRKFAETTGIKGIGRIVRATSKVIRFFWLTAIIICFGFLQYQLSNVIGNYFSHSVTRVAKVNPNTPNFPDVTICNLFPASNLSSTSYNEYLQQLEVLRQYVTQNNIWVDNRIWNTLHSIEFYNGNSPILETYLNSDDSFVVECSQYGWDLYLWATCRARPIIVAPLQKCHLVELDWSNGTVAAISVILFTNNFFPMPIDNYNTWIRMSTGTGVRVMINPRNMYPNQKTSIRVATGKELYIQLQQTNITRLPYPYGNCTVSESIILTENDSISYTAKACISLCRQQQRIENCQCLDNNEIFSMADLQATNHSFCCNISGMDANDSDSIKNHIKKLMCIQSFTPNENICDCPMRCSDTEYDATVSSSQWPDSLYQLSFYKQYIKDKPQYGTKFAVYDDIIKNSANQTGEEILQQIKSLRLIEDNFVRVTIMFSMETYQMLTDTGTITWDTLVANLGGTFNLWLGICVPTFAEIIELLYSILIVLCRKRKAECVVVKVAPIPNVKAAF